MFNPLPIISTEIVLRYFKLRLLVSSWKGRLDIKNVFRQRFSLGMVLLLVYGAQLLWGAFIRQRSLLLCGGIVLLLVFCGRTVARNRDWASRQALIRWVQLINAWCWYWATDPTTKTAVIFNM